MKVVIIGGGIAGLTAGILLKRKNIEVVINEHETHVPVGGNAFLMHAEADNILKELTDNFTLGKIPGKLIDRFCLRRPDNSLVKFQKLNPWHCLRRKDIVELLYGLFPHSEIRHGRTFSHFLYEDGKIIAAVFENGAIEYGDIFIGSDGGGSLVRETIFGKTKYSKTEVKEVLGEVHDGELRRSLDQTFLKFQSATSGISFGMIPTGSESVVWYMQYDCRNEDVSDNKPESIRSFCKQKLKDFPPLVHKVIHTDTFERAYIWQTRDFDLLPSFHKENVVLIGDAAHLALPFTSAGTTNALVDASTLVALINPDIEPGFQFVKYYQSRSVRISEQIELGRQLKSAFLNPMVQDDDMIHVPLVGKPMKEVQMDLSDKALNIIYFTDPICSTCWAIQPQLRKLQLEYRPFLDIKYLMAGLLPSWNNFNRNGITRPADVAQHWQEVCESHDMPINHKIWIDDPLSSSFPPSIAFKAAQLQDTSLAIIFLRRIREMLFIEKKNIIQEDYLSQAAFEVGLDTARLMRDLKGKAVERFKFDLKLTQDHGITMLPSIIITNKDGRQIKIEGFQPYERLVDQIRVLLPDIQPCSYERTPQFLFNEFNTLTLKEFTFLSDIGEVEAVNILESLERKKLIHRFESQVGDIWLNNYDSMEVFS